jgi:hypothetical protein
LVWILRCGEQGIGAEMDSGATTLSASTLD